MVYAKRFNDDAPTETPGRPPTALANRCRILRPLGRGGMGSVWLAEDVQLDGKPVAIKMLPSVLVANKRAYLQLKREALVAMKLVHQNIVALRSFEENAECQVRIVARKSGFWAWLMSVLGIDSTFTLEVYRDRIESEEESLCGRIKSVLPLSALETYTSGYTKPFAYLVVGVILAVEGLVGCFAS